LLALNQTPAPRPRKSLEVSSFWPSWRLTSTRRRGCWGRSFGSCSKRPIAFATRWSPPPRGRRPRVVFRSPIDPSFHRPVWVRLS